MRNGDEGVPVEVLDLTGLKCPLPSLLTEKALRRLPAGGRVAVIVTDPMAPLDLAHLCQRDGHTLLETIEAGAGRRLLIRKGPPP